MERSYDNDLYKSIRDITEYEDVTYSERTANVSEDMNTDKFSTASSGLTLYYIQCL